MRIYGIEDLLDTVYFVALIFMLVNDFSVLYAGKLTKAISSTQAAVMYFSGNKFSVVVITIALGIEIHWKKLNF